jgi:hypothetical protein
LGQLGSDAGEGARHQKVIVIRALTVANRRAGPVAG